MTNIKKYVLKNGEVEAIKLEHCDDSKNAIIAWSNNRLTKALDGGLFMPTIYGHTVINTGSYVIKHNDESLSAMSESEFIEMYIDAKSNIDIAWIERRIAEILSDERLSYATASIVENAPLALVQLSLETELRTLERIIGTQLTNVKKLRNEI